MKKILCYGDSNTFGYVPADGSRYSKEIRWTGILSELLQGKYEIIEEGCCDRTGFVDNEKGFLFSGNRHFPQLIEQVQNEKIDIIILALGTNDLQFQYGITMEQVELGLKELINIAKQITSKIILIPPVEMGKDILSGNFNYQFDETSIEKSKKVGKIYNKIAQEFNCLEYPINNFVKPSPKDGLHYEENAHKVIAQTLAQYIIEANKNDDFATNNAI